MLSSQSITRRFTPPTCTLEIEATSSSLSRWTKQQAIKDVQFQLSFDDPRLPEEQQVTVQGDRTQLEQLIQAVTSYVHSFLQQSSLEQIVSSSSLSVSTIDPTQPYLQPQGLVTHELFLGSLGDRNSGEKIKLSAVQLFDLVTALEGYQVEIAAIPNLDSTRRNRIPLWATAAASIVLVVGLTTVGLKIFNQSSTPSLQESESAFNKPKNTNDDVIPPQVTKSPKQPATQKKLQDPLSSAERLPPPPPVDLPKPPPANVPDPANYPFPQPNQIPIVKPSNPQVTSRIAITPKPPEKPTNDSSTQETKETESNLTINPEEDTPQIPDLPPLSPSLLPSETDIGNNSVAQADSNNLDIEKEESTQPREQEQSHTNPQLKEIETYFRQQWQPPEELKQTIEYRLVVSADGSIVRITPIGKASAIFLDRTNIPLMGEPFISPTATKGNQTIRLLLSPDGEVRIFDENK